MVKLFFNTFLIRRVLRRGLPLAMILTLLGGISLSARSAQNDYVEVYRYAYMALQEGKWLTYKRLMRTVIDKATAGGVPPEKRAIYWYEYGRASGVVCDWEDAEFALTTANNIDAKTGGPVFMSFNELGRMNVARKQYKKAIDYFMQSSEILAQRNEKSPEKKTLTPLGNAQIFEDFALALEQTEGSAEDSKRLRNNASEIRKEFTARDAVVEDVTPYGTQCSSLNQR